MRVCHVVYSYYPFDPRVRKEVAAVHAAGHDVDVIAMRDTGEPREEVVDGVPVHRVPLPIVRGSVSRYFFQYSVFFLAASALLLRLHIRQPFAIIHVHSLPDFQIFCAIIEKVVGARVVLDLHEAMPEILAARLSLRMDHPMVRIAGALEWSSCAVANRVVVVNDEIGQLIVRRGVARGKVSVVLNSPDLAVPTASSHAELRSRLGIAAGALIVYAGGINPERDLETVIRAGRIVASSRPLSLLVFGRGSDEYRRVLRGVAKNAPKGFALHLGDWIPQEEVLSLLAASDVGLAPYVRNPITEVAMPNKVFEYAALRIPMVLADLKTLKTMWGGAALFYEPGNPEDLAVKIERVLGDTRLATALTSAAQRVYERCRWESSREVLLDMYRVLQGATG